MALNKKQQAFVEHYITHWNASKAARLAGYSERTAGAIGHKLLKNVEIETKIQQRLDEISMEADEVLIRLSDHARADLGPYLKGWGSKFYVDVEAMQRDGKTHLIKKLHYDAEGNQRLELHDAQTALLQLAKMHGLFDDKEPPGSEENPLSIRVVEVVKSYHPE